MSGCKYPLRNGQLCGKTVSFGSAGYCLTHHQQVANNFITDAAKAKTLLSQLTSGRHSLSNHTFKDISFKNSWLTDRTPLDFTGVTFIDCELDGIKFYNADINDCTFVNTSFRNCQFRGDHCLIFQSKFNSSGSIFDNCKFELHSSNLKPISTLHLSNLTIECPNIALFECHVLADEFYLDGLDLRCLHLEIKIGGQNTEGSPYPLYVQRAEQFSLDNLKFNGRLTIAQTTIAQDAKPKLRLSNIDFNDMRTVLFTGVNLENTTFDSSHIEAINFVSPVWGKDDNGRSILYDHPSKDNRKYSAWDKVLQLYIQLKNRCENARDHGMAGDWFYREMECKRELDKISIVDAKLFKRLNLRTSLLFHWGYGKLTDYGENAVRPVWVITLSFFIFGLLYMLGGFTLGDTSVLYEFPGSDPGITSDHVCDYGKSIVFSIAVLVAGKGRQVVLDSPYSIAIFIVQALFMLTVVPLFLLALRRKFKR